MDQSRPGGFAPSMVLIARILPVVAGAALLCWSVVSWPGLALGLSLAFAVAFAAVWSVSLRLTRGEVVNIDVSIGLAAALVLPVQAAIVSSVIGSLLGALLDRKNPQGTRGAWAAALTRPVPVLAAAGVYALCGEPNATGSQAAFALAALCAGAVYLIVDAVALAPRRHANHRGVISALRPLGTLYLGHVSIGIVLGLLFPWMGLVGLLVLTLLVLVMQNSYSMYLRTRAAYQETIGVLALASEIQTPVDSGHSQRVADTAAAVGKRLHMPSRVLETLNYAALLHDIGCIGAKYDSGSHNDRDDHPRVGAEMVQAIPFLASAKTIIEHHHGFEQLPADTGRNERLGTYVVGLCCEYDFLLSAGHSRQDAVGILSGLHSDETSALVLEAIRRAQSSVTVTSVESTTGRRGAMVN